jgi:osmotically-inducible protein OsmY
LLVVSLVAAFALGRWSAAARNGEEDGTRQPTATTGTFDTTAARERAAQIGEKAAIATNKVEETVNDARLASKIKAKMALDDYVRARTIDVTTDGSIVTLSGEVRSVEEHDRAVRLAREAAGISEVVDRLRVSTR